MRSKTVFNGRGKEKEKATLSLRAFFEFGRPEQTFDRLRNYRPRLAAQVYGVLYEAERFKLTQRAAVAASCEAINDQLIRLEFLKQLQLH